MEEVTNEVVEETTEIIEETKPYEFKEFTAEDIFTMVSIISKIGINKFASCFKNEGVQELVKSLKNKKTINASDISLITGGSIFMEVAQIIIEGMPKCKDDIYKILSDASNLSLEQVKTLKGATFIGMIIDFVKKEDFKDFFKEASRLVK